MTRMDKEREENTKEGRNGKQLRRRKEERKEGKGNVERRKKDNGKEKIW